MKLLFISCLFPFVFAVFAPACTGQRLPAQKKQRISKPGKAKVEGYIELDGKPLSGATVVLVTMTTHPENDDWVLPIIGPRFVAVVGVTGTPIHEAPDWYSDRKTDKSGHFRAGLPGGKEILVFVTAGPWFGHGDAWSEKLRNAACGSSSIMALAQSGAAQKVRYNLDSTHTMAKGGCAKLFDSK